MGHLCLQLGLNQSVYRGSHLDVFGCLLAFSCMFRVRSDLSLPNLLRCGLFLAVESSQVFHQRTQAQSAEASVSRKSRKNNSSEAAMSLGIRKTEATTVAKLAKTFPKVIWNIALFFWVGSWQSLASAFLPQYDVQSEETKRIMEDPTQKIASKHSLVSPPNHQHHGEISTVGRWGHCFGLHLYSRWSPAGRAGSRWQQLRDVLKSSTTSEGRHMYIGLDLHLRNCLETLQGYT